MFIDGVQNVQFPNQPLAGRVRLVHHGIEGVFDDGRLVLGHHDVLFFACAIVVDPHLDMLGIPLQNAPRPHGQDVVGVGFIRVQGRIHRDHSHAALVHHGHIHILAERPARLVQIGLQGQAGIQPCVHLGEKAAVFIQTNMPQNAGRRVHGDAVID